MEDFVLVEVCAAFEELFHVAFDLRDCELHVRILEKAR